MAELGDERSFKRALREAAGVAGKEKIERMGRDVERRGNRILMELAQNPPPDASLDSWAMRSIAESSTTYWSPSEPEGNLAQGDQYVIEWTHPHADKIEVGVKPHVIEGNPILVFPWPNGPEEVLADFRPQWEDPDHWLEEPEVIFAEVKHPGIPGTGFIRDSWRYALDKHFDI